MIVSSGARLRSGMAMTDRSRHRKAEYLLSAPSCGTLLCQPRRDNTDIGENAGDAVRRARL